MKKWIALVLCAALLAMLFGCGAQEDTAAGTNQSTDADIVATVNGRDVTMEEFEYFVRYYMNYMEQNYGTVEDWTAAYTDDQTYEEFVKDNALQWFVYSGAIAQEAERLNLSLTDEDEASLEEQWQSFLSGYDSEEAAQQALTDAYCTETLYKYILRTQYINDMVFNNLYGENGAAVSDDECASMTENDGYIMAKHILMLTTTTDANGDSTDMSDEEKAQIYAQMQVLKAQLESASEDEKADLFNELMNEYSEDTGLASYPDGYLFQEGDMVDEFYQAAAALEIGGISDIVETSYGYHIIMRIPINYDVIPSAYSQYASYGYDYLTLRYLCAENAFNSSTDEWMEHVEYSTTAAYDAATIADMCAEG